MNTMLRLDPPLPLNTPDGSAMAHIVLDYGFEHDLIWICFMRDSGECWAFPNSLVRAPINSTAGRTSLTSFMWGNL